MSPAMGTEEVCHSSVSSHESVLARDTAGWSLPLALGCMCVSRPTSKYTAEGLESVLFALPGYM